ncbi:Uncharacterised protein [Enterobacter hormaechei]|nr:Uncharacterised protein [Enterobacter hormaechei]
MFPDKIPHKIGCPERRSTRNDQLFHQRDRSGLINILHMLQQMPYNLINTRFTQGKPWITDPEASAHLIGMIEEKMNQPCALFEIAFSNQARSQSAQYMFEPGS